MCLINTHTLMYRYASCNCKLWESPLILLCFWVFSYIIDDNSCMNCFIFTKLSEIMCLIDVHILECQHTKCDSVNFHILLHV